MHWLTLLFAHWTNELVAIMNQQNIIVKSNSIKWQDLQMKWTDATLLSKIDQNIFGIPIHSLSDDQKIIIVGYAALLSTLSFSNLIDNLYHRKFLPLFQFMSSLIDYSIQHHYMVGVYKFLHFMNRQSLISFSNFNEIFEIFIPHFKSIESHTSKVLLSDYPLLINHPSLLNLIYYELNNTQRCKLLNLIFATKSEYGDALLARNEIEICNQSQIESIYAIQTQLSLVRTSAFPNQNQISQILATHFKPSHLNTRISIITGLPIIHDIQSIRPLLNQIKASELSHGNIKNLFYLLVNYNHCKAFKYLFNDIQVSGVDLTSYLMRNSPNCFDDILKLQMPFDLTFELVQHIFNMEKSFKSVFNRQLFKYIVNHGNKNHIRVKKSEKSKILNVLQNYQIDPYDDVFTRTRIRKFIRLLQSRKNK
eukprot:NODE_277_length_10928_cov_0.583987.p2 type:complete len:422 gc:universal NODE_277_length_10928_cov_0.583987:5276-4011(-)